MLPLENGRGLTPFSRSRKDITMPVPAKPCPGQFSGETIQALLINTGRAQWRSHHCALCGQQVGAVLERGQWSPERHWPSVSYVSRSKGKRTRPAPADGEGASL
jgi:hypothetical protein